MSQTYKCPHCSTPVPYTPDMAGQLAVCPGCQEMVHLPAPKTGPIPIAKTGPAALPPIPKTGPAARPPVPKTTISDAPPVPPRPSKSGTLPPIPATRQEALPSLPPVSKTQAVPSPQEAFADLDQPTRRRPRDREPEPKSNVGLIVAAAVGGLLLVGGGIAAVVVIMNMGDAKPSKVAEAPKEGGKDGPAPKTDKVVDKTKDKTGSVKPATTTPVVKDDTPPRPAMKADMVRQRAVRSVAWVVAESQQTWATGVLIDDKKHLVLTSYHPFAQSDNVRVYFPTLDDDGKANGDPKPYLRKTGIPGVIVKKKAGVDLALIQLDMPALGFKAMAIEPSGGPEKGDTVMALRAVGPVGEGTGQLWQSTTAKVWRVNPGRSGPVLGQTIEGQCVETESDPARENGDTGGPLVNTRGMLVGVVSGLKPERADGATHIDLREVMTFLGVGGGGGTTSNEVGKEQLPRLVLALNGSDVRAKRDAVRDLGNMGQDAKGRHNAQEAVPALLKAWGEADAALAADIEEALNRIGPPGVADIDVLRSALKSDRREAKLYALQCLKQMGEKDGPERRGKSTDKALPELLLVTKDKEGDVRAAALMTLPEVTTAEKEGVTRALLAGLKDAERRVKLAALSGLGKLGQPVRAEVIEELIGTLGDKDELVAAAARKTIDDVHPLNSPKVTAKEREGMKAVVEGDMDILRRCLKHEAAMVRRFVASELYHFGRKALPAMAELSETIKDSDPDVRVASLRVLQALGQDAVGATEGLIKLLGDADTRVRAGAALTLGAIGSQPGVYPALLGKLMDKELDVRRAAGKGLQDIKKPVAADVAQVIDLLNTSDVVVRKFAAAGLGGLEKAGKDAWPTLAKVATGDKSLEVRLAAITALGEGGEAARPHSAVLAAALKEKVAPGPEDKQLMEKFAEAPEASETASPDDKTLVNRGLLLSTVWVADTRGGFSNRVAATGFIVDARNRLIVTSGKIFRFKGQTVYLYPPQAPKGKDLDDIQTGLAGTGRVLDGDPRRDITVIATGLLPPRARGLTFASGEAKPNEDVSAMGTKGANRDGVGQPFNYMTAKVDRIGRVSKRMFREEVSAQVVELNSPLHVNDSGGPVVNSRMELIGMKTRADGGRGAVALAASEIRDYVRGVANLVGIGFTPRMAGDKGAGPGGDEAIEKAKSKLTQTYYRTTTLDALKKMGLDGSDDAISAVVALLGDAEAGVREKALAVVTPMGAKLKPSWKAVFALCSHEETRKPAEELLLTMGADLAKEVYEYVRSSKDVKEMKAGVGLLKLLGGKSAKTYLNRIENNGERPYPKEVRDAARDAMRTM